MNARTAAISVTATLAVFALGRLLVMFGIYIS